VSYDERLHIWLNNREVNYHLRMFVWVIRHPLEQVRIWSLELGILRRRLLIWVKEREMARNVAKMRAIETRVKKEWGVDITAPPYSNGVAAQLRSQDNQA
jgi:hypothetical protein